MQAILINYDYDPTWLQDFPDLEVTMYDRSDDGIERNLQQYGTVYKTSNTGDVDFDKISWLIQEYDNLPETFLWSKSNIFKFVDETYLKDALNKKEFTPLLKFDHKTYSDAYGVVCRYSGNIYEERADSWFFNNQALSNRFRSWEEWCEYLAIPVTPFIPFAPGGSYILTRERVHRYSKDFYAKMRDTLPYAMHPAEAHAAERTYYMLWK